MDYSRETVDQIKKILKQRGVVFPSKARKADLLALLAQDDAGNKPLHQSTASSKQDDAWSKQESAGGKTKVNTMTDPPLPQSTATSQQEKPSSKMENTEAWIVETEERYHGSDYEPDTKIVGIYSSKELAIKNAKIAFANFDTFGNMDGWDASDLVDNSKDIGNKYDREKGCKGGVLFKMGQYTGEGDTIAVSIYKFIVDKPIKSNDKDYNANDSFTEDE